MKTNWEILGIEPTNNKRLIKKAYAKKVAQYHPEEFPNEFQEIQEAYKSIMDLFQRDYSPDIKISRIIEAQIFDKFHQTDTSNSKDREEYVLNLDENNDVKEDTHKQPSFYNDYNDPLQDASTNNETSSTTKSMYHDYSDEQTNSPENEYKNHNRTPFTNPFMENEQHAENNTEDPSHSKQRTYYYQQLEIALRHSNNLAAIQALILNHQFYDLCQDYEYYKKICTLIIKYLNTCDLITTSFFYDVFSILDKSHPYMENLSVPISIREKAIVDMEKKEKTRRLQTVLVIALIAILCIAALFSIAQNNKVEQDKKQEFKENYGNKPIKPIKPENSKVISKYVERAVSDKYKKPCSCSDVFVPAPNSTITLFCDSEDSAYTYTVTVKTDSKAEPKSIDIGKPIAIDKNKK